MRTLLANELWDYSARDLVRGLRTAILGRRNGAARLPLPGIGQCLPVRSARAGIVLGLKVLGLPLGARVGVPLYCCPVVFKAIVAAGCTPRFVDIDARTYCLSASDLAEKSRQVDAVLAVHMFGNLCDVPRLRNAAPGKPIVEDCAQALGSRLRGGAAGSFGEVAVFSFRLGKCLSVGEGGAIYTQDAALGSALSRSVEALPAPGRLEECLHVGATYARSLLRSRFLWGPVGTRVWKAYNQSVSYTSQSPLVIGAMHKTDIAATLRRLPRLAAWIHAQRANVDYYQRNLAVNTSILSIEPPDAFYNRLQYPLLLRTPRECAQFSARLRSLGVGAGRPYSDIANIAKTHYGYTGDCPVAERVAETVLVIPCHHRLRAADVSRVARSVGTAWAETLGGAVSSSTT